MPCVGAHIAVAVARACRPQTGVELDEIGSGKTALAVWEVGAPMTPMWHTYYGSSYIITVLRLQSVRAGEEGHACACTCLTFGVRWPHST